MKRKVVLFIITQLFLLGVLYLTLNFFSDFDLIASRPKDVTIEIVSSDRESDTLELSIKGAVEVFAEKKVIWCIGKKATDVRSFYIEGKDGYPYVFNGAAPQGNPQRCAVGHLKRQKEDVVYGYSIHWTDALGGGHEYDPKIAIRPGKDLFEPLIYVLYALFAAIIFYMTFRKQKSSETRPT